MCSRSFELNRVSVCVFKTDVENQSDAEAILEAVRQHLPDCDTSFDLEDCDNVLRVESSAEEINESKIKQIIQSYGYRIEILP